MLLLSSTTAYAQNAPRVTEEGTIVVQERRPIAFLLGTPTGELAKTRSSEIIRMLSEQLSAHTNFYPEIADPNLLSKCRGQLGCMAESVRSDYAFDESAGLSYDQIQRKLARDGVAYPRYLLVMSNVAIEGQADRLAAVLVDTDIALAAIHDAARSSPGWRDEVETQISGSAVLFGPERVEVRTPQETEEFLDRLFSRHLWQIFDKSGNWEPYGEIEIRGVEPGYAISLDGNTIGTASSDPTRLTEVASGLRKIRVEHPTIHPFETDIDVARSKKSLVEVNAIPTSDPAARTARTLVTWSGVGLAAVGVGLTAVAILRQDSAVKTYCFKVEGSACVSSSRFATLGYDPSKADVLDPAVNPSGIMLAPLGYSLVGVGATWALGTELFGSPNDVPWIPLAAGAAVGVLSYALSGVMQPADPLTR